MNINDPSKDYVPDLNLIEKAIRIHEKKGTIHKFKIRAQDALYMIYMVSYYKNQNSLLKSQIKFLKEKYEKA